MGLYISRVYKHNCNYDNNNYPIIVPKDNDKDYSYDVNSSVDQLHTGATTSAINNWIHLTGTYDGQI
jgi:hypothetical protein